MGLEDFEGSEGPDGVRLMSMSYLEGGGLLIYIGFRWIEEEITAAPPAALSISFWSPGGSKSSTPSLKLSDQILPTGLLFTKVAILPFRSPKGSRDSRSHQGQTHWR